MSAALHLTEHLRPARNILVFTGAGISTGSGIPDFRGPGGVWSKRKPVYFDQFLQSEAARHEYWDYKLEAFDLFARARPNATHDALVALERMEKLRVIVTQNIDGLHQQAGSGVDRVIEVHGTNRWVECVKCWQRVEPAGPVAEFRATGQVPRCACGGWQKFATISFGQALSPEVLERAMNEAEEADLVVSLGSTLSVHPAASIPLVAARRGVPYIVINRGETDHDKIATVRIEADVGEVVPEAVGKLATCHA